MARARDAQKLSGRGAEVSQRIISRGEELQPGPPELSPGFPASPSLAPPSETSCHQFRRLLGGGGHSGGIMDVNNANAELNCTPHN